MPLTAFIFVGASGTLIVKVAYLMGLVFTQFTDLRGFEKEPSVKLTTIPLLNAYKSSFDVQ